MKCPECDKMFIDYLYDDILPEDKARMEEHLKTCPSCTNQLSQLRFVSTAFRQLKRQEASSLVHQRILAHSKDIVSQKRKFWLTGFIFRPAAATIMVILVAIGIFSSVQQFSSVKTNILKLAAREEPASTALSSDRLQPASTVARPALSSAVQGKPSELLTRVAQAMPDENNADQMIPFQSGDALHAFELGNFYFSQNDFEKAIASYSIALTMNPKESYTSLIRYQLALSYKKLNDCNSAVQVLDDIQKRFPNYRDMDKVFMMAGDCYLDLKAYDKAEINYSNLINRFPDKKEEVVDKLETARKFRRVNLSY